MRIHFRCRWLAALGFAWVSGQARADEAVPPGVEKIQVHGERWRLPRDLDDDAALEELRRTPGGVAAVGFEEIERIRALGLEDVIGGVPGVLARSRGLGEEPQISIRGSGLRSNFHTRGVNVLIDGFPFQNADGFSDVESFEFLAARRVEVYKGVNSLRYGDGALGGALNIVTRTGRDAPPLRARLEGGAFGFRRGHGSGAYAAGPWDAYLAVSHTESDGYRDHAEQNRQRFYGSIGRQLSGGASLRLDLNAVRNRVDIPGALTRAELDDPTRAAPDSVAQDEARDYEFGRMALALALPLSEAVQLEWQGQTHYQELWHPLAFGIIENRTRSASSELRLAIGHALPRGDGRFSLGLQGAWTDQPQQIHQNLGGHEGSTFSQVEGKAINLGLYAVDELELGDAWSLVIGARAQHARRGIDDDDPAARDDIERYFWLSPTAGAIWRFADGAQLYANVGRSHEIPVLFELAAPGNLGGDLSELEPQRAWQFELGTRGAWAGVVDWDVSVFDLELRDEIRNLNVEPFPGAGFTIPRYENIERSRHWGLELAAGIELAEGLRWSASYTLSRFVFVDDPQFGSNDLPGAPRYYARSELRYRHASGLWIAPTVELTPTDYYVDSFNTEKAPRYALLHLRMGYDHERSGISGYLEIRNLTDRDYVSSVVVDSDSGRFFEPGDGRGLYAGVVWKWR